MKLIFAFISLTLLFTACGTNDQTQSETDGLIAMQAEADDLQNIKSSYLAIQSDKIAEDTYCITITESKSDQAKPEIRVGDHGFTEGQLKKVTENMPYGVALVGGAFVGLFGGGIAALTDLPDFKAARNVAIAGVIIGMIYVPLVEFFKRRNYDKALKSKELKKLEPHFMETMVSNLSKIKGKHQNACKNFLKEQAGTR